MRQRLCGISSHVLNRLRKGDEKPAYTPMNSIAPFNLLWHSWQYYFFRVTVDRSGPLGPMVTCQYGIFSTWSGISILTPGINTVITKPNCPCPMPVTCLFSKIVSRWFCDNSAWLLTGIRQDLSLVGNLAMVLWVTVAPLLWLSNSRTLKDLSSITKESGRASLSSAAGSMAKLNSVKSECQKTRISHYPIKFSKPNKTYSRTFKDHLHFQVLSWPWICNLKIQVISRLLRTSGFEFTLMLWNHLFGERSQNKSG